MLSLLLPGRPTGLAAPLPLAQARGCFMSRCRPYSTTKKLNRQTGGLICLHKSAPSGIIQRHGEHKVERGFLFYKAIKQYNRR